MSWLYHILFQSNGAFYAFVSGWGADLSLVGGAFMLYRKHNCHVHYCLRICRFDVAGTPYRACKKHHPEVPSKGKITFATIEEACLPHDTREHFNAGTSHAVGRT